MLALVMPNPKISWKGLRGSVSTSAQKLVRPVRVSQALGSLAPGQPCGYEAGRCDNNHRRDERGPPEKPSHPSIDHEEAHAGNKDAYRQSKKSSPRVRKEKDHDAESDANDSGTPGQAVANPEQDRQPSRDRRILSDLSGSHWPENSRESAAVAEGLTGRQHECQWPLR